METYFGQVRTPSDAIVLFEACRIGLLPRVQRRLSEKERQSIRSGSVFVWDEREAGMRRWTDGKSWSASRVAGSFLNYREMEGKRGGSNFVQPSTTSPAGSMTSADGRTHDPDGDAIADGYRYKPDGLVKQSFSITTTQGQHLHLISYYARSSVTSQSLPQPSSDPALRHIQPPKGLYPESTVADGQNMPAVTRSPMVGSYTSSPSQIHGYPASRPSPAMSHYGAPGYGWPPSPLNTPPAHYGQYSPYSNGGPPSATSTPAGHSPAYYPQAGMPQHHRPPTGPTAFDRAPPSMPSQLPPPPPPPPTSHPAPTSHPHHYHPGASPPTHRVPGYPYHDAPPSTLPPIQNGTHAATYPPRPYDAVPPQHAQAPAADWARGAPPAIKHESPPRTALDRPSSGTIPSIGHLVSGAAEPQRSPPHIPAPYGGSPHLSQSSVNGGSSPYQGGPPKRPSPPLSKREHGAYDKSASFGQDNNMLRQLDRAFSVK